MTTTQVATYVQNRDGIVTVAVFASKTYRI